MTASKLVDTTHRLCDPSSSGVIKHCLNGGLLALKLHSPALMQIATKHLYQRVDLFFVQGEFGHPASILYPVGKDGPATRITRTNAPDGHMVVHDTGSISPSISTTYA